MKLPSSADLPRIAAAVRLAGDLLEMNGDALWELTRQWEQGPRAARFDVTNGGTRWEEHEMPDGSIEVWPVPADPTGEAAMPGQNPEANYHAELRHLLKRLADDSSRLRDLMAFLRPSTAGGEGPDQWCSSHLRIAKCVPPVYGDLCEFCWSYRRATHRLPTTSLLEAQHQGRRITQQMIDDDKKRAS